MLTFSDDFFDIGPYIQKLAPVKQARRTEFELEETRDHPSGAKTCGVGPRRRRFYHME